MSSHCKEFHARLASRRTGAHECAREAEATGEQEQARARCAHTCARGSVNVDTSICIQTVACKVERSCGIEHWR
eukprot:3421934-Lingulodinium_polyedra.AAC.1